MGLQLREGFFDWVEVGTVGRQIAQFGADGLDGCPYRHALTGAEVVHHDDVTLLQCRHENLLDIGLESFAVDRAVEQQRRDDAGRAQTAHESCRFSMSMGYTHAQSLTSRAAAADARHIGRCPSFVDEDEALGGKIELAIEPVLPALQDVRPILLCGVRGLFFHEIPCWSKNRHNLATAKL